MATKLDRSVFLYSEPKDSANAAEYAQCKTCEHFLQQRKLCYLMSVNDTVYTGSSCNEYAEGKPIMDLNTNPSNSYKPEEIGLVHREVRCLNCQHFETAGAEENEGQHCELYEHLNQQMPEVFNLDIKVNEHGCCTANTEKTATTNATEGSSENE